MVSAAFYAGKRIERGSEFGQMLMLQGVVTEMQAKVARTDSLFQRCLPH